MSWIAPMPEQSRSRLAVLGGAIRKRGLSMLSLLPSAAYKIQMGVQRIRRINIFLVNAPETVRHVLTECPRQFPKHQFLHDGLAPLIGTSVFNASGQQWQQQRRLVDQAFDTATLRGVFPLMCACVTDMLARLQSRVENSTELMIDSEMSHVTADIIHRTILSEPLLQDAAERVHASFDRYQAAAQRQMGLGALHLPPLWYGRVCKKAALVIRETYAPKIRQRYRSLSGCRDEKGDMLAALINAVDPETGHRFGESELIDQMSSLFLAGHETSASTLCWALWLLSQTPEWHTKIRIEADHLWTDREPKFGDTHQLSATQALFKETLRLYPPIPFYFRHAEQSTCLREKPVAQGDMVVISPWTIQRHQLLWSEPNHFKPERFIEQIPLKNSYLPFGLGERACAGAAFAMQESVLILASIVRQFDVLPSTSPAPAPIARLTLRAAGGVTIGLKLRSH